MNEDLLNENIFHRDGFKGKNRDFNFYSETHSINSNNFPVPFFQIVGLFAEDCAYNIRTCYSHTGRLFVEGDYQEEGCELMLRYGRTSENALVVSRVQFINRRKGKMTELYRILKLIQSKYETGKIVIESVETEEMRNWCQKNGFVENQFSPGHYAEP